MTPEARMAVMNLGQAYNNLGVVYLKQGKFEKASDCFEKAIRIDPKFYIIANENLKKANMICNRQ